MIRGTATSPIHVTLSQAGNGFSRLPAGGHVVVPAAGGKLNATADRITWPSRPRAVSPQHLQMRRLMGVRILATSGAVPDHVVTNQDLERTAGFDPDWIVQRTGIQQRRIATKDLSTSDLAYEAAQTCIERSGVSPSEIDLVVLATITPDSRVPATACLLQDRLGICAPAFDMQASCAGFLYALVTAAQFVSTGNARYALIVGADCVTRIVDPRDQAMFPLFGDGAGAALIGPGSQQQGLEAYNLGSDGSRANILCQPMGGSRQPVDAEQLEEGAHFLQMEGRPVFKWAVQILCDTIPAVLGHAELSRDDIDLFVLHQANLRILNAAAEMLGLDPDKLVVNVDRYGNTSGGSVPLALDEAYTQGRIQAGSRLVLSGFGAGLAWGTAVFRW